MGGQGGRLGCVMCLEGLLEAGGSITMKCVLVGVCMYGNMCGNPRGSEQVAHAIVLVAIHCGSGKKFGVMVCHSSKPSVCQYRQYRGAKGTFLFWLA